MELLTFLKDYKSLSQTSLKILILHFYFLKGNLEPRTYNFYGWLLKKKIMSYFYITIKLFPFHRFTFYVIHIFYESSVYIFFKSLCLRGTKFCEYLSWLDLVSSSEWCRPFFMCWKFYKKISLSFILSHHRSYWMGDGGCRNKGSSFSLFIK